VTPNAAGISTTAIAKLGKGNNLNTDTLFKICGVLDCDIADICEVVHSWEPSGGGKNE